MDHNSRSFGVSAKLMRINQKVTENLQLRKRLDIDNLLIHPGSGTNFVVSDGMMTIRFKASTMEEKEKWLSILRVTKAKLIYEREIDESDELVKATDITEMLERLAKKQTEIKLNEADLKSLKSNLTEKRSDGKNAAAFNRSVDDFVSTVNKSMALVQDYLQLAEVFTTAFKRHIRQEKSQVEKLESVVQELGTEQTMLEQNWKNSIVEAEDIDHFYDSDSVYMYKSRVFVSDVERLPLWTEDTTTEVKEVQSGIKRQRRKAIPPRHNLSTNYWEVFKNSIGKDLSKLSLPVNFCEPISLLQRLTEDLEYSHCLENACRCPNQWERFAWVAAYSVSCYSSTVSRFLKPFNPLLGETYECDRTSEMGWKSIAEQVSHHPPIIAMHAQGKNWTLWQEQSAICRFRGKYFQVTPIGVVHLLLKESGDLFTWNKANTIVHNIIMGKPWIENYGEVEIVNNKTAAKCILKYQQFSMFSREIPNKVSGMVYDKFEVPKFILTGTWSGQIEGAAVISQDETDPSNVVFQTAPPKVLWTYIKPPEELIKCYNFSSFAVTLNEPEPGVAPTDSRFRPDQRSMEEGRWEEANRIKKELEDRQRARRLAFEKRIEENPNSPGYSPKWFKQEQDQTIDRLTHVYTGEYWACKETSDWSRCPVIFSLSQTNLL